MSAQKYIIISLDSWRRSLLQNTTDYYINFQIITARKRSVGKVMFSLMSVCLSVSLRVPMWSLPMMNWTSLYRISTPWASDLRLSTLAPVSDIWCSSLETCSNLFIRGPPKILLECFLVCHFNVLL